MARYHRIKEILMESHSGIGGLYFVSVNILMAFILVISLHLSWSSQAIAMADNLSYLVSINCTVHNYVNKTPVYDRTNPTLPTANGGNYNPLSDFNQMARDAGILKENSTSIRVSWDGTQTSVQVGEFKTVLGDGIIPHLQNSTIENY